MARSWKGEQVVICVKCRENILDHGSIKAAPSPGLRKKIIREICTTDHIWEKADGGQNNPENLQKLHLACHRLKTKLFQWRRLELKRKLTKEESLELNKVFIVGSFKLVKEWVTVTEFSYLKEYRRKVKRVVFL